MNILFVKERINKWLIRADITLPLDLSDLQLETLPELPNKVCILYCFNNKLTSLSISLPNLKELYCWNNELTSIDTLPDSLEVLQLSNNKLTSLNNLPLTLNKLYCYDNMINQLDLSTNINLQKLFCWNNQLTCLTLPISLEVLYCNDNKITSLSELPLLKELDSDLITFNNPNVKLSNYKSPKRKN